ncbi:MAG: hypothetical protein O3C60_06380 [Planctomycetota bacterium]|nr:hypothetical protein [Planctomycetota bacterium]
MRAVDQSASLALASNFAVLNSVVGGLRTLGHLDLGRISPRAWKGTMWITTCPESGGSHEHTLSEKRHASHDPQESRSRHDLLRAGQRSAFLVMQTAKYAMYSAKPIAHAAG